MRKYLLFAAITALFAFCGCENYDEDLKHDPQITFTTNKKVGETIVLRFSETGMPTEVTGAKKISEEVINMDGGFFEAGVVDVTYSLTSQTVVIKGDITGLRCENNSMASMDVSRCPGLTLLQCNNNQLTTLNVSNNPELIYFFCSYNQLAQLDVSKNTKLEVLSCSNNKITSLDVSKNTELGVLYCNNNKLSSLDVSKHTGLYNLDCRFNKIKVAEMSKIIKALPDWTGKRIEYYWPMVVGNATLHAVSTDSNEENEISEADIKIAEEKNWKFN